MSLLERGRHERLCVGELFYVAYTLTSVFVTGAVVGSQMPPRVFLELERLVTRPLPRRVSSIAVMRSIMGFLALSCSFQEPKKQKENTRNKNTLL